jgi:hypothetical protein
LLWGSYRDICRRDQDWCFIECLSVETVCHGIQSWQIHHNTFLSFIWVDMLHFWLWWFLIFWWCHYLSYKIVVLSTYTWWLGYSSNRTHRIRWYICDIIVLVGMNRTMSTQDRWQLFLDHYSNWSDLAIPEHNVYMLRVVRSSDRFIDQWFGCWRLSIQL